MTPAGAPMVKPRELVRALERMGFRLLRTILRDVEVDWENLKKWF